MRPDGDRSAAVATVEQLSAEQVAFATRLVRAASAADGVAPLSEQSVAAIDAELDASSVRHLISTVGYANALAGRDGEPPMIEAVIDPSARRRGHGTELLRAAFAAAAELPGATQHPPRAWAHGDLPAAVALAATLGLSRTRELLQLRRDAAAGKLPPLQVADDIELRTYRGAEDDAEIRRVNNAAFDWHPEQGGQSPAQIRERIESDWFDPQGLFLAFDRADPTTLLGFHWTKRQGEDLVEVYIVGVDPAAQGRGLGKLLTLAGLHYFAERDIDEVLLYVEGDNTAALHTYERLGFGRYAIDVAYGRSANS